MSHPVLRADVCVHADVTKWIFLMSLTWNVYYLLQAVKLSVTSAPRSSKMPSGDKGAVVGC